MFGVKEPLPVKLRSGVVYMFAREGCNACYVGGTVRSVLKSIYPVLGALAFSSICKIDHFTVACLVNWPLNGSARGWR